jgi:hypothetical protein
MHLNAQLKGNTQSLLYGNPASKYIPWAAKLHNFAVASPANKREHHKHDIFKWGKATYAHDNMHGQGEGYDNILNISHFHSVPQFRRRRIKSLLHIVQEATYHDCVCVIVLYFATCDLSL